jgi:flagellar basal-body rod modification protein FlgD
MGTYPIEAVRFENGAALVKVGSNYVPLDQVKEVY